MAQQKFKLNCGQIYQTAKHRNRRSFVIHIYNIEAKKTILPRQENKIFFFIADYSSNAGMSNKTLASRRKQPAIGKAL